MSSPVYLIILKVIKKSECSLASTPEKNYHIVEIKKISPDEKYCNKDDNPFVIKFFLKESPNSSLEKAGKLLSRIGELVTEIGNCNEKAFEELKEMIRDKLLHVVEIECSKDYTICKLVSYKELPFEALLSKSASDDENGM